MIDKKLLALIGDDKKYIFYTVIFMTLGMLANVGITASICWAIYLVVQGATGVEYIYPVLTAVVSVVVRYFSARRAGALKEIIGSKIKKSLRERTYNKILRLGVRNADDMNMAGLTQVTMEGIEQLDLYYSVYLPQFFFALIAPIILFTISVGIDWRVSVVLLACVPLIPLSIILVSKYAKKIFAKYWGKYTSMGDVFLDSLQGLKELKIFDADGERQQKINQSAEEFRKITMKVLVMQLASITVMDLVAFGGAGIGIAIAVSAAANGAAPIAALFLILIAVEFFLPLRSLGSAFHVAMNGASAGHKIIELLNIPDPEWGEDEVEARDIVFEDVTFSYNGDRKVLKNANMSIPEKGITAIVGESGSGKSTIVNLIMGANRAESGKITIGGKEISKLSQKSLFSHLAVVSYNTYIFNQSIKDNFKMAKPDCSEQEIIDALKAVNLDKFIEENGGLDKVISEDANNISGGQKQRLALAVNLIAGKNIYVFDEATSNIDIESEAIIMKNIKELSKKAAVILISHRLANVVAADNIYYLQQGKIKEAGTHSQLVGQGGGYAQLFLEQRRLEEGYKNRPQEVVA